MGNEISTIRRRLRHDADFRARWLLITLMSRHNLINLIRRRPVPRHQWTDLLWTSMTYWSLSTSDAHAASYQQFGITSRLHRGLLLAWLQHKYTPVFQLSSLMAAATWLQHQLNHRLPAFADAGGLSYITAVILSLVYNEAPSWLLPSYRSAYTKINGASVPLLSASRVIRSPLDIASLMAHVRISLPYTLKFFFLVS